MEWSCSRRNTIVIVFVSVMILGIVITNVSHTQTLPQTEKQPAMKIHLHTAGSLQGGVTVTNTHSAYHVGEIMNATRFTKIMGNGGCMSGHISGFAPVCGNDGCLRTLNHDDTWKNMEDKFKDEKTMKFINGIEGWCEVYIHANLARELSHMQWKHNVIGSVGEIGVYMGKYSSILALVTNTAAGERYFAADIFEMKTKLSHEQGRRNTFFQVMQRVGFTINASEPAKRLHLFSDSSMYISKSLFVYWDLPSFRMLSIDGGHLRPLAFNDFEKAACIMQKGGIIIFDDAFNTGQVEVKQAIQDFFSIYGPDSFKPIIFAGGKLFVCTSDFYSLYMKHIKDNLAKQFNFKEVDENVFIGKGHRYFVK